MSEPAPHRLFAKQLAAATAPTGVLDVAALAASVGGAYGEAERDRRRTERAMALMADEIERANQALERVVQDLRVQNLRFETAIENMSLGIAMYDANEILAVTNERLNEVLSVPPGTIRVGMSFREVVAACMACGHFRRAYPRRGLCRAARDPVWRHDALHRGGAHQPHGACLDTADAQWRLAVPVRGPDAAPRGRGARRAHGLA